jgi:hypothetical protein
VRGRKGRFVGKSCTLPLLDRLSMLEGREVGAHWERMSRCQRDKLHTVCNVCIGERKHSPVIGRAKESPFLAVGGETLDQRERRTGVKRWSIAHRRRKVWDEGKCTCTVVMYDFLGRVLSDYANSAYEIYNPHLLYVYPLLTTLEWPDWILLGQSAFNQLSLSLYLEAVMGLPRLSN